MSLLRVSGPLPKADCERIFKERGCDICWQYLVAGMRQGLKESCFNLPHAQIMYAYSNSQTMVVGHRMARFGTHDDLRIDNIRGRVVALACKMVGGGSDGSLDL
ncbi:hypothetical protein HAX54_022947 [Datura stramonium]|uniref:Uncharacterized protein n=1 Tax=Datura stramonium TaxID=4076 RepID=A0ABS8UWH6_DATST|nr:hypothetical protein [Datura stramonium]